jgi:hypothetical protein
MATMMLLVATIRLLYKYGAFKENSCPTMDQLHGVLKEQDHFGICVLSVLGSIGSEGKNLRCENFVRIFFGHCP